MYQTKIDLGYDPIGSYTNVNPFTMAFCRTEKQGNVIVTGGLGEVTQYIKSNLGKTLASLRMWHKGRSRGYLWLWGCHGMAAHERKNRVYIYNQNGTVFAEYGRVPSTFPNALRERRDNHRVSE